MADAKSNSSPTTTPEARLERLLSMCRLVQQNWNDLISALSVVEGAVPDREYDGAGVAGLLRLIINNQNDEYSDFVSEIALAAGEAA